MIAIADYGIGNLGSALKAFRALGAEATLVADPARLSGAKVVVLPGDGAFGATMHELRSRRFDTAIMEAVAAGVPLVGICVGMQALFESSEERGEHRGLGLLRGRVRRLPETVTLPHMGWNALSFRDTHPFAPRLARGLPEDPHVHFVHSYACEAEADVVVSTSTHGETFPALVFRGGNRSGRVVGLQFHPEKSQTTGLAILRNVLEVLS